jgi:hypothetical protein
VSALIGAGIALALALAAQVVAHLIASGYMTGSAILVAATSAVPPLTVAHMLHLAAVPRTAAVAPVSVPDVQPDSEATNGRHVAAESVSGPDPVAVADEYWQDFAASEPESADTDADSVSIPPTPADIKAAMDVIASAKGRPVTGAMLAEHYGVSDRTGRRYLALAAA